MRISIVERTAPKFLQQVYRKVFLPVLGEEIAEWLIKQSNLSFEIKETNESWSAYNYYERGFRGHIVFNKKAERNIFDIPIFVAHEAYPGHHATALIREALYVHGMVGAEATMYYIPSYAIGFTLVKDTVERYGEEGIRILYNPCNPTILSNAFPLKWRRL